MTDEITWAVTDVPDAICIQSKRYGGEPLEYFISRHACNVRQTCSVHEIPGREELVYTFLAEHTTLHEDI